MKLRDFNEGYSLIDMTWNRVEVLISALEDFPGDNAAIILARLKNWETELSNSYRFLERHEMGKPLKPHLPRNSEDYETGREYDEAIDEYQDDVERFEEYKVLYKKRLDEAGDEVEHAINGNPLEEGNCFA